MSKRNTPKDDWLLNAEVQTKITYISGRWEVSLVFIDTKDPKRILVKRINDFRSKRLAEINANYMQKTAAKDSRGTQKANKNDYDINNN
ncbi:MAG: hypothetical protein COB73_04755 [Flavobacteriaceae bacterium]|nr:MAG: hypothetical protein COB73_04755 [Flavobacteriaceae bacterium]